MHSSIRLRRTPAARGFDVELAHCAIVFMVDGPTVVHTPASRLYIARTGVPINSGGVCGGSLHSFSHPRLLFSLLFLGARCVL